MPPVVGAIAPLIASVGAALNAGALALGGALGLSAGTTFAVIGAFQQLAASVALSALGRALAGRPKAPRPAGITSEVRVGEDAPASFLIGRHATAGDLLNATTHDHDEDDDPNELVTIVVELSDWPQALRRVMVNGEWVSLGATADPMLGRPVPKYRRKGRDYLWIKYFDGTQTAVDPGLVEIFAESGRPWESDMVGLGVTYAAITAKYNPKLHRGIPEVIFELEGIRLYDPRRDTTAGGSGPQRWANQATWSAAGDVANDNPIVQVYNLMLGIRDPVTDEYLVGTPDISQRDLPAAEWFAAMNACDADAVASEAGLQRAYQSGIEVRLADDYVRADTIEELLKACAGQVGEGGGRWSVRVGPPGAAVWSFTDDDVIVTSPEDLDPFPGLEQVFNGVTASYPEPSEGWAAKDAPRRVVSAYVAADGGRPQVAALQFPSVWRVAQVQRLMLSALKEQRRFRRHVTVLPPDARPIGLFDTVARTSVRNGYEAKAFTVDLVEDLADGCVAVSLREVDPSDYDFGHGDFLPTDPGITVRPPTPVVPPDFSVEPATVLDADGVGRRPAIRAHWNPNVVANGVRYRVRATGQPAQLTGGQDYSDDDLEQDVLEVWEGEPLEVEVGVVLEVGYFSSVALGTALITDGVLPATPYQVAMRYDRPGADGPWSAWMAVTTPDTRLTAEDLHSDLVNEIEQSRADAEQAREDALAAVAAAQDALDQVAVLAGDTIEDLEELIAGLEGLDAGDIVDARRLALSGLPSGWNADPIFRGWTGGALDRWTVTGGLAAAFEGDHAGGGMEIVTTGATSCTVRAASDVSGQLPRADAAREWIVLGFMVQAESAGALTGIRVNASWKAAGSGVWTRGTMRGTAAAEGTLAAHGVVSAAGRRQGVEVLVRRPAGLGAADAVSVAIEKLAGVTGAVTARFHSCFIRAASEAEVEAGQAAGALSAAISTVNTTIAGVSSALAAVQTSLTASIAGVSAELHQDYLTEVEVNAALSTLQTSLTASIAGVSATLGTNYYTRVQVDAGITTAIAAFASTLGLHTVEGLSAALTDEAALRISGDAILGGRLTSVEARNPGSVVTNGGFGRMDGAAVVGWVLPGHAARLARGSSALGSAVAACPAPGMLHFPTSASESYARSEAYDAAEGDVVAFGFSFATGGSSRNASPRIRVRFLDAAGASIATSAARGADAVSATAWVRSTAWETDPAPAGTAAVRVEVWRAAGGSGELFVSQVEAGRANLAQRAAIQTAQAVATGASGAIATLTTAINAEFGSQSAFIDQMSTAYANGVEAISGVKMRLKAGAATGIVEMAAFAGGAGLPSGSVYRLGFDHIDLDGKVSARQLAVFDSTNLVPDDQLQDPALWGITASSGEWSLIPTTEIVDARSIGEIRWTRGATTTGTAILTGKPFPVTPGDKLVGSYRTRVIASGSPTNRAWANVAFYDIAGDYISSLIIDSEEAASTTVGPRPRGPAVGIVPAGAVTGRWRWVVDRVLSTGAGVRFLAPQLRKQTPTVLIEDGAITADKILVSDLGAIAATLGTCTITSALNLAPGVVVTGALALNSVTDVGAGVRESLLTISSDDTWYDVATYAVTVPASARVLLSTRVEYERNSVWNGNSPGSLLLAQRAAIHEARLLRGTTVVHAGTRDLYVDTGLAAGSYTYRLQVRTREPDPWEIEFDSGSRTFEPTSRVQSARVGYGHVVAQVFKR